LPVGQEALEFVYWPPGFGRLVLFLRPEFSPAGLLALTGTHLLFFSEGEVLVDGRSQGYDKYGYTVTYCPVSLIRAVQIVEHKSFHSIVVDVCVNQCGEELRIRFPGDSRAAVSTFAEAAASAALLQLKPEGR
jgi:hypothetical protein